MTAIINEVAGWIRKYRSFVITSHEAGDGDSIGSQIAMAFVLQAMKKDALILNKDPVPEIYDFLPGAEKIRTSPNRKLEEFEAGIYLDCGSTERTGLTIPDTVPCLNIDHHLNNDRFCELNWVDAGMSSTAEMVYLLADALSIPPDTSIGSNLYTGILTDTGCFTYNSTSPRCLRIAAALVEAGVQPSQISSQIYGRKKPGQLLILGAALSNLTMSEDQKIATILLKGEAFERHGATFADAEGIVNYPLTIASVEVSLLFKEMSEGFFKVSFRSRKKVNVAAIAEHFGGGGHRNAAGAKIKGNFTLILEQISKAIHQQLANPLP
ncbi:MAG: bifunctional oligoribonuclease/PAP phosphatase NrnA [bacterium]